MTPRPDSLAARAAVGAAIIVLAAAGCGSDIRTGRVATDPTSAAACRAGSAFALSLVSDTGGQPSPVAAATWFATHGGVGPLPRHGWHVVAQDADGASLEAGSSSLHAVPGRDGTWQVDGGTRCR